MYSDTYTGFRNGDTIVKVYVDLDGAESIGSDFSEMFPGVVVHDHAWNPSYIGDREIVEQWGSLEDDLAERAEELELIAREVKDSGDEFYSEVAARVVDVDEVEDRRGRLLDNIAELRYALDSLENSATNDTLQKFRHSPYVDTNGYSVIVDKSAAERGTGLKFAGEDLEKYAMSAANMADDIMHGNVYFVETYRAEFDDATGEFFEGENLDSVGGVMFANGLPDDEEIWEYVKSELITAED